MKEENTLIAGRNPVMEALKSKTDINSIMIARGSGEGIIRAIIAKAKKQGIPVKEVSPVKLDALIPAKNHQGVVANISPIKFYLLRDILKIAADKGEDALIIILDGIEDVHNFGAIARTAEACGAHGIVIHKHGAAPVSSIAVKASAGALMHVPIARVTNITKTIMELKEKGLWIAGTDMTGDTKYYEANLKGPIGVVIGSEGKGMSRLVRESCDFNVNIPMAGKMSSLNASNAAAIVLFEILKQRTLG
ncbi:MAG: 23S rRNA (guanosine(2251)-2'-O)-methyltransferase RlmB [Clostridiales bacterium]|nr:23S rRNA (guanosine(2251)-2'-O)-methyltransferase RlmB [Clostridiales bacterium]